MYHQQQQSMQHDYNRGSSENMVSKTMVKALNLKTEEYLFDYLV